MDQLKALRGSVIVLLTVVGSLSAGNLRAQEAQELDYEIHFTGAITDAGEKYLIEGLRNQNPTIQYWIDRPTQSALARTQVHLDRVALQMAITPSGLVIGHMRILTPHQDGVLERSGPNDDFPLYIDTAHPEMDQANYIRAKAHWFASHGVTVSSISEQ